MGTLLTEGGDIVYDTIHLKITKDFGMQIFIEIDPHKYFILEKIVNPYMKRMK